MFTRYVAAFALIPIALIAVGDELRDNEMINGGASADADGLWVSSPSLYLRRGTPGVAVGMVKLPGKDRIFSYVLIIKGDEQRKTFARFDGNCSQSGLVADSSGSLEITGKKVEFKYKLKVDQAGQKPPQEMFSINGKDLEISKGRVVLIDLSAKEVTWKQVQIDLPKSPSYPSKLSDVELQAKKMVEYLRSRDKAVGNFLK